MLPNDIENVFFVGGMADDEGWMTESQSVGRPIIIASVDADGNVSVEDQPYTGAVFEEGFTWEEYVTCFVHMGMDYVGGVLNGWPEATTEFLQSVMNGHETWAMDWQDTALSYLSSVYDVYPESGLTTLKGFLTDDTEWNSHNAALTAQGTCGERTVTLFLVACPFTINSTTTSFWQVCGEKWEPDAPSKKPIEPEQRSEEFTPDEMVSLTSYFGVAQHNGLLRTAYSDFRETIPYMEIMMYDMGKSVTDPAERAALASQYFEGSFPTPTARS